MDRRQVSIPVPYCSGSVLVLYGTRTGTCAEEDHPPPHHHHHRPASALPSPPTTQLGGKVQHFYTFTGGGLAPFASIADVNRQSCVIFHNASITCVSCSARAAPPAENRTQENKTRRKTQRRYVMRTVYCTIKATIDDGLVPFF